MSKIKNIVFGIVAFLVIVLSLVTIRYNLTYGNSLEIKILMAGCINRTLDNFPWSKSKSYCECALTKLLEKYEVEELRKTMGQIVENERELILTCLQE